VGGGPSKAELGLPADNRRRQSHQGQKFFQVCDLTFKQNRDSLRKRDLRGAGKGKLTRMIRESLMVRREQLKSMERLAMSALFTVLKRFLDEPTTGADSLGMRKSM